MKKVSILFFVLILLTGSSVLFAQIQILSGKFSANSSTPQYTLDKNSGERSFSIEVNFDKPFDKKPKVVLSITMIDVDTKTNVRYNVEAISISRDNFTIKITTWSETKIYGIAGSWIAHTE